MGQVLLQDKIGALSEAGGTITLQPSRLTIGGQQYTTTSALNVAADVSSANTRYQIFATVTAGVVSLVVSSNENSVGPAGEAAWKLVGSYYTNSDTVVAFGSFVTIEGVPTTLGPLIYRPAQVGTATGTYTTYGEWNRIGSRVFGRIVFRCGNQPASGQFEFTGPFQAQAINWSLSSDVGSVLPAIGVGQINDAGSSNYVAQILAANGTNFLFQSSQTLSGGVMGSRIVQNGEHDWDVNDSFSGQFDSNITGWDSTPIKDL